LKIVYDVVAKINQYFIKQLQGDSGIRGREYLSSRNVTDESVEKFQLGYAPDNDELLRYLLKEGVDEKLLIRSGVFLKSQYSNKLVNRYSGRLMFPIFDAYSRCVGFGGRILDKSKNVKYINSPETEIFSKHDLLYGYSLARHSKSRQIIIVEGYLDVIAMHQAGFDGAVAPLGTAINKSQIEMCWRVCDFPIVSLDGDNAGVTAAYRWIDRIFECLVPGKSFKFAQLPQGTDPDILISEGQKKVLIEVLKNAIPLSQWLWDGAFSLNPSDTPEQKAAIVKNLLQKTNIIPNESIKRFYVQEIKKNENLMYQNGIKKNDKTVGQHVLTPVVSVREKFEKIFVVTILNHPYILDKVIEDFVKIEMNASKTKTLQKKIVDCYENFSNNEDEYIRRMREIKQDILSIENDVVLHAKFASEESSDDVALQGWNDAIGNFLAQPNLSQDLQSAVSSLQSSFSEDDWLRLKALKKEDIFVKNKWKI